MSQNRKRSYQKAQPAKIKPGLLLVLLGVLLALAAVFFALKQPNTGSSDQTSGGGTPKLAVDKTKIDFGDQHFNNTVTAAFKVTNTGTGTLKFTDPPTIEVKEGC